MRAWNWTNAEKLDAAAHTFSLMLCIKHREQWNNILQLAAKSYVVLCKIEITSNMGHNRSDIANTECGCNSDSRGAYKKEAHLHQFIRCVSFYHKLTSPCLQSTIVMSCCFVCINRRLCSLGLLFASLSSNIMWVGSFDIESHFRKFTLSQKILYC